MTVAKFRTLVKAQYIPGITGEQMRDQFKKLKQEGMIIQAYDWRFTEFPFFVLKDVATNALRVDHFN